MPNSEELYDFHNPSADCIVPDHDPGDELFVNHESKQPRRFRHKILSHSVRMPDFGLYNRLHQQPAIRLRIQFNPDHNSTNLQQLRDRPSPQKRIQLLLNVRPASLHHYVLHASLPSQHLQAAAPLLVSPGLHLAPGRTSRRDIPAERTRGQGDRAQVYAHVIVQVLHERTVS